MSDDVARIAPTLRGRDVTTLRGLSDADWKLAATIMSCGVAPQRIAKALREYSPGREYEVVPAGMGQGKRTILAYSFVRDQAQYAHTYGQSDAWAGEMRGLLEKDPDAAKKEIAAVVNARLSARGSSALAVVTDGQPRGSPGAAATGGASDVNYPPLQALMVRYSAQAGVFRFDAEDDGEPGPRRFIVRLGGPLVSGAQKKATAIMAARLARVVGRGHSAVAPYMGVRDSDGDFLWGQEIPDDAPDGRPAARRESVTTAPATKTSPRKSPPQPAAGDDAKGEVGELAEKLTSASLDAATGSSVGKTE
ncbi:Proline-Alanine-Serine rich protein [Beauveria bassiana polymycovirus 1]|uniref:Proline-Alanine-Serine rich protein n=1 Tax=Beauveria bassiana polymycovirus 1 TaxID=1740646 RepID=A0A1V1IEU3_9VIRU|nr:Proline-Alanine-Serine rich protein [Beauveria bassiana polymycovirus 1]CUS18598.1 Proline-Alanine-Serine rich protein [Beauveria bassiana polymycovirus 1]